MSDWASETLKIEADQGSRYEAFRYRGDEYKDVATRTLGNLGKLPTLAAYLDHPRPVWVHCKGHSSGVGLLLSRDVNTIAMTLGSRPKRAADRNPFSADGHLVVGDVAEVLTWRCDTCTREWNMPAVQLLQAALQAVASGNLTVYP